MSSYNGSFWDERYSSPDFIYGAEPNDFFRDEISKLKPGKILLPGEGEGRNAVYAAKLGWEVYAIDFSKTAAQKAIELAEKKLVKINYTVADLSVYWPEEEKFNLIAMIYSHLPPDIRRTVHKKACYSLEPGGMFILEMFSKDQLGKSSGGPQSEEMLYSVEEMKKDTMSLTPVLLEKKVIKLDEGIFHKGDASVIRYIGINQ